MKIDQNKGAWMLVALAGLLLTAGGLLGVWLQGRFYEGGFPTAATVGEVRGAFTWPTIFTSAGSFVSSAVILDGPFTASWTLTRRLFGLIAFAAVVLTATAVGGYLAGSRVAPILN